MLILMESKKVWYFASLLGTIWVMLTPTVCPISSSAVSFEENKKSVFPVCFEKGRGCFFIQLLEIRNASIKKGWCQTKEWSPTDNTVWKVQGFSCSQTQEGIKCKKHSRMLCLSCLGELTHRAAFPVELAAHGCGHALRGQCLYSCLRYSIFQRVNMLCLQRYYLMSHGWMCHLR